MTTNVNQEIGELRDYITNTYVIPETTHLPEYMVMMKFLRLLLKLSNSRVATYSYGDYRIEVFSNGQCDVLTEYGAFMDGDFSSNKDAEAYILGLDK